MKILSVAALIISISLIGCSVGFINKETTLQEQPFAVETMRGNVRAATRCVDRYWRKSVLPAGAWWKMNPESLPILASGIGIGGEDPPVSLVMDFNEVDGKTISRAYMHHSISTKDERREVALQSLAACRDSTRNCYNNVKAIVLKNGKIIEGRIISIDHDVLKVRTKEGRILSYSFMNDVKKYIMK